MKAGIAIDSWKLPVFERHLAKAGYSYEKFPGVTKNTLLLQVVTNDMRKLQGVIMDANVECAHAVVESEKSPRH